VIKDDDEWEIKKIIKGDTVNSVLTMLHFNKRSLVNSIETSVQKSVDDGDISHQKGRSILNNMKKEINDYTYLDF